MHEYQPQEQPDSYQQAYQPQGQHNSYQQAYQPVNSLEGPSYSPKELFSAPLPHTDVRFVAALTYSLGWFSGLLFTLFARESRYVRFHALQSLLFFGGINVLDIALLFIGMRAHHFVPFIGPVFFLSFLLLNAIAFVGWLVAIVQAYRGSYYKLPLVGDVAARSFSGQTPLK
jgi:uncharacterized membrane protein